MSLVRVFLRGFLFTVRFFFYSLVFGLMRYKSFWSFWCFVLCLMSLPVRFVGLFFFTFCIRELVPLSWIGWARYEDEFVFGFAC